MLFGHNKATKRFVSAGVALLDAKTALRSVGQLIQALSRAGRRR